MWVGLRSSVGFERSYDNQGRAVYLPLYGRSSGRSLESDGTAILVPCIGTACTRRSGIPSRDSFLPHGRS